MSGTFLSTAFLGDKGRWLEEGETGSQSTPNNYKGKLSKDAALVYDSAYKGKLFSGIIIQATCLPLIYGSPLRLEQIKEFVKLCLHMS